MATLVTGGVGFVGANIVKGLAKAGHQVVCFDLSGPDGLLEDFIGEHSSQVSFAQGDILDREGVGRLGDEYRIDKIVHAAVFTVNRVELETQRSRDIVSINIEGTANLLELARKQPVDRFVYVSSGAVYGGASPPDQTLNEEVAPVPQNLYGITKYASELLTRRYGELHQISTASVRLSTPYGPMERVTGHRDVMSPFYHWTGRVVRGGGHSTRRLGPRPGLHLRYRHRRRNPRRSGCARPPPRPLQHHGGNLGNIPGNVGPANPALSGH